jgi:hypothetical protein
VSKVELRVVITNPECERVGGTTGLGDQCGF